MDKNKATHEMVKKAYGEVAKKNMSCCGGPSSGASCCPTDKSYIIEDHVVPESEMGLSCGNPLAFSMIKKGDTVVDLGSGGGKDVFMAAEIVGSEGRSIGIDMTHEMLELANRNAVKFAERTGLKNVEFREGYIEKLPVESDLADVVISNCVINLSTDKQAVFNEIYRSLKNGGNMIVSDIVLEKPISEEMKNSETLYSSCVSGALLRNEYLKCIENAGFKNIRILSDKKYSVTQVGSDPITGQVKDDLAGCASSITVAAQKYIFKCSCGGKC